MTGRVFLIGAGGTAGHVIPALAVADALRAHGAEVVFAGGERAERTLVPEAGYELRPLRVVPLPRKSPVGAVRAAAIDARGRRPRPPSDRRAAPAAVLGAGGYVAGPVGLAAVLRRVPLVLMEADSHLGSPTGCSRPGPSGSAWPSRSTVARGSRYRVTGPAGARAVATDREAARSRFGIEPGRDHACSSSAAARARARSTRRPSAAFAGAGFRVLHAAGERDLPSLERSWAGL